MWQRHGAWSRLYMSHLAFGERLWQQWNLKDSSLVRPDVR
jgi:hypothetical protein